MNAHPSMPRQPVLALNTQGITMSVKALDLILKLTEELRGAKHTENSEGRAFYPDSLPRIFTPNSFRVRFGCEVGADRRPPIPITPTLHHSRSPHLPEAVFGAKNAPPQRLGFESDLQMNSKGSVACSVLNAAANPCRLPHFPVLSRFVRFGRSGRFSPVASPTLNPEPLPAFYPPLAGWRAEPRTFTPILSGLNHQPCAQTLKHLDA